MFILLSGGDMNENEYQAGLIKRIQNRLPGCLILKNDPNYVQGILDLTVFYGPKWAMIEVKASEKSKERPNQRYYVKRMSEMGFAAFIYPENEEEVLNALQSALAG
jgi:hypothetical protein